jgi:hypothetical protein
MARVLLPFLALLALALLLYPRLFSPSPSPEALRARLLQGGKVGLPPRAYTMEGGEVVRNLELRGEGARLRLRSPLVVYPGVALRLWGVGLEGEGLPFLLRLAPGARLEAEGVEARCEGCRAVVVAEGQVEAVRTLLDGGARGAQVVLSLGDGARARLEEARLRGGIQACLLLQGKAEAEVLGGEVGPSGHAGVLVLGAGRYRLQGVAFRDNPTAALVVLGEGAEGRLEGVRVEGGRYALYLGEKAPAPVLGAGNVFRSRQVVGRLSEGSR